MSEPQQIRSQCLWRVATCNGFSSPCLTLSHLRIAAFSLLLHCCSAFPNLAILDKFIIFIDIIAVTVMRRTKFSRCGSFSSCNINVERYHTQRNITLTSITFSGDVIDSLVESQWKHVRMRHLIVAPVSLSCRPCIPTAPGRRRQDGAARHVDLDCRCAQLLQPRQARASLLSTQWQPRRRRWRNT
jgi:hypothetical protein